MWTIYSRYKTFRNLLIPPFNISSAIYYREKFISHLSVNAIIHLGDNAFTKRFNDLELNYLVINKFGDISMGYKYRVVLLRMDINTF